MLSFSKPVPPQMNLASVHRLPVHRHRLSRPELGLTPTHPSISPITLLTYCPWSVGSHQDPRPHKCKVPGCWKAYVRASGLEKHMLTIHGLGAGDLQNADTQDEQPADPLPYKCIRLSCRSGGFRTSSDLRSHERSSRGLFAGDKGQPDNVDIRRFVCKITGCNSIGFTQHYRLIRHMKDVHGMSNADQSHNVENGNANDDAQDDQPNSDGHHTAGEGDAHDDEPDSTDDDNPCPYKYTVSNCHSKGFSKLMALRKHTKTIHEA